ncbi:hypothetical protein I4U23_023635 [Adineta vaga]|nr:hypothetical protein I4U23_023635 [Adineta vaga]
MPNISNQDKSHTDMRLRDNREESGKEHLTKDGQPDHRYKENRSDNENSKDQRSNDQYDDNDDSSKLADIPTKADGTADMRYAESKEAVAAGLIEKDEVIEEAMNGDDHQHNQQQQSSHRKQDGTEDKRYKENQQDRDEE